MYSIAYLYSFFGRLFPYTAHTWGTLVDYSMRDLRKDLLQSKRFMLKVYALSAGINELLYVCLFVVVFVCVLHGFRVRDAIESCAKTAAENGESLGL